MKRWTTVLAALLVWAASAQFALAQSPRNYVVVDTGQNKCYDNVREIRCPRKGRAFYGQDAQYQGPQPAYRDNGDGTVTDLNTGLMWVKARGAKVTFAQAVTGAPTCSVGGYTDWRMPTIKELYSLIDFKGGFHPDGQSVPYIDTGYFDFKYGDRSSGERPIDCQDWSSTQYIGVTGLPPMVFGVNFADGRIKAYPKELSHRGAHMPGMGLGPPSQPPGLGPGDLRRRPPRFAARPGYPGARPGMGQGPPPPPPGMGPGHHRGRPPRFGARPGGPGGRPGMGSGPPPHRPGMGPDRFRRRPPRFAVRPGGPEGRPGMGLGPPPHRPGMRPMRPRTVHRMYVRYVRGNPAYGANRFRDNGDGTITDLSTGLMWSKADSGSGMNWEAALRRVQNRNAENYLGHSDWRLPNAKELQSIVDYNRTPDAPDEARKGPAIDPVFDVTRLSDGKYPYFWTSTTHLDGPVDMMARNAVYVAFGEALGYLRRPPTGPLRLYDIHGAGAQRSDPKTGDPSDYPHGRGPQGDVIRINNFVRCVRTAE